MADVGTSFRRSIVCCVSSRNLQMVLAKPTYYLICPCHTHQNQIFLSALAANSVSVIFCYGSLLTQKCILRTCCGRTSISRRLIWRLLLIGSASAALDVPAISCKAYR